MSDIEGTEIYNNSGNLLNSLYRIEQNNYENFADVNLTEIRFESELTLDRVASPVTVLLDESIV